MIHYLPNTEIDFQRWDACISGSVNRRVYGFSWYLDIVSPGWDALVMDDYTAVFPVTHNRKYGIRYLAQPFFTQQLGVFSPFHEKAENINTFVDAIPKRFKLIEINLNYFNKNTAGIGKQKFRRNHELNLQGTYQNLASFFSSNAGRNIKKSMESGLSEMRDTTVDDLINLFSGHFGKKEGKLQENHYQTLNALISHCLACNMGFIRGVITNSGKLSSGAFFLFDNNRVYFLFAASAPEARDNGSMFFLIDRFIHAHAGNDLILDFEGGNDPDLGRFYKGFGSTEVVYPVLQINNLSKVSRIGYNLMHKLR